MENQYELTLTNVTTGSSITRRTTQESLEGGCAESMISSMLDSMNKEF